MSQTQKSFVYEGGCHCEAIRFRVEVFERKAIECNCSICRKKGFIHLIVPRSQFTLLRGDDSLSNYTFNTGTAKHKFCSICGIHAFYHPRSHPDSIDVNVRCLDNGNLADFEIEPFDGANWEDNVDKIR